MAHEAIKGREGGGPKDPDLAEASYIRGGPYWEAGGATRLGEAIAMSVASAALTAEGGYASRSLVRQAFFTRAAASAGDAAAVMTGVMPRVAALAVRPRAAGREAVKNDADEDSVAAIPPEVGKGAGFDRH